MGNKNNKNLNTLTENFIKQIFKLPSDATIYFKNANNDEILLERT